MPDPRRRLAALAAAQTAIVALLVAVLVWAVAQLAWYLCAVVGLAVGAAVVAAVVLTAPRRVLRSLGAEPADEVAQARYANLVDGLCLAFGLERPSLLVLADDAPNLASVAGRGSTSLVATSGLLAMLDRVQLEGVVAHQLARIRNGDAAAATVGVALIGFPLLGGRGPIGRSLAGGGQRLEPTRDRLWRWALGPGQELAADLVAVGVTRYPPGLHRALTEIRDQGRPVASAAPATVPLWLHDPDPGRTRPATFHPPIDERIDVLGEL